jgi:hypothetical protein
MGHQPGKEYETQFWRRSTTPHQTHRGLSGWVIGHFNPEQDRAATPGHQHRSGTALSQIRLLTDPHKIICADCGTDAHY